MANALTKVPKADVSIELIPGDGACDRSIKLLCRELLEGWKDLSDDTIEISVISGGISNALYKVTPPEAHLDPVAFRIYGQGTDHFIDRSKELTIMADLHTHGFGPALLGLFSNGRIEAFLRKRCLTPEEMSSPAYIPRIARTLARFHAVNKDQRPSIAATPFGRIKEWIQVARNLDFSENEQKQKAVSDNFDFDDMLREVEEVEKVAETLQSPMVFAHNDLLSGNIMVDVEDSVPSNGTTAKVNQPLDESMTFIDFEYSVWAPRGFDLGNHFNEYAGFECDYSRYPDQATAARFVAEYLDASRAIEQMDDGNMGNGSTLTDTTVDNTVMAVIQHVIAEANVYALASHQYWGTWAIMQAKWSQIDFDYMSYAKLRWDEYRKRKEEFLVQGKKAGHVQQHSTN